MLDYLRKFLTEYPQTREIEILIPDLNGVLRGKRIPVRQLDKLFAGQVMIPKAMILLDSIGNASDQIAYGFPDGDPDFPIWPLAHTLTPMPWRDTPAAQVLAGVGVAADEPWFANSATVLDNVLQHYAARGWRATVAVELEFHLLDPTKAMPQVAGGGGNGQHFSGPQTYNLEHLADYNEFLDAVSDACDQQNIPLSSALTEFGEGQFELNLQHTDDVQAACNHSVLLKRVVRQVARQQGYLATFMAKPFAGNSGNGMHIHLSLADSDGQSLFSTQGHQLSPVLSQALAGMLTTMPQSMALFAPNANSYRRFEPDTFVPLVADWGHDHRAVAIRLPRTDQGDCRIEHRTAGADANPYLVVAATLAGILHGVEAGLEAPPATGVTAQSAAAPLPLRWIQALDEFGRGNVIARYLGTEFHAIYHQVKRDEERHYHHLPSQQDCDLYLRLV